MYTRDPNTNQLEDKSQKTSLEILKSASLPKVEAAFFDALKEVLQSYNIYHSMDLECKEFLKSNTQLFTMINKQTQDKSGLSAIGVFQAQDISAMYFCDKLNDNSLIRNFPNITDKPIVSLSVMTHNGSVYEQVFSADGKELLYIGVRNILTNSKDQIQFDYQVVDLQNNANIKWSNVWNKDLIGEVLIKLEANDPSTKRQENIYLDQTTGCYQSKVREQGKLLSKSNIKVLRDGSTLIEYQINSGETNLNINERINKKKQTRDYVCKITDKQQTLVDKKITQRPLKKNAVRTTINNATYTAEYLPEKGVIQVNNLQTKEVIEVDIRKKIARFRLIRQAQEESKQEVAARFESFNNGVKILTNILETIKIPQSCATALNEYTQATDRIIGHFKNGLLLSVHDEIVAEGYKLAEVQEEAIKLINKSNSIKKLLRISTINDKNTSNFSRKDADSMLNYAKEMLEINKFAELDLFHRIDNELSDIPKLPFIVKENEREFLKKLRTLESQLDSRDIDKSAEQQLASLLLTLPADQLLKLQANVTGINLVDKAAYSVFVPDFDILSTTNNTSTVLHELGHAVDFNQNLTLLSSDADFLQTYQTELEHCKKSATPLEWNAITYFTLNETSELYPFNGNFEKKDETILTIKEDLRTIYIRENREKQETFAESNMLLNILSNNEGLGLRALTLMRYFPKTIAKICQLLEQK
jgi:hypothetical protein